MECLFVAIVAAIVGAAIAAFCGHKDPLEMATVAVVFAAVGALVGWALPRADRIHKMDRQMAIISEALEGYRSDHGRYPAEDCDLGPVVRSAMPADDRDFENSAQVLTDRWKRPIKYRVTAADGSAC